jgi:hypothetical protein
MFIASADHALKIGFIGARLVSPANEEKSMDAGDRRQGAPPLGRVFYDNLWDGVTLVYERHESGVVKSTYFIRPAGTDAVSPVGRIRLRYDLPVAVDEGGGLVFSFENGHMRESRPVAWQVVNGEHVPVEVSFRSLGKREIGFRVESYDPKFPLVIDPVLSWHTYMGSADGDFAHGIAVDGSGNVFVAGWSEETWGAPINPHAGGRDAFVAKLSSNGERLWHTFMGSSDWDEARNVAVDASGNVYVTGVSDVSWGAPVGFHEGGGAFAAKFDGNGVRRWHTFIGLGRGKGITVDSSGNVYVAGWGGWCLDTPPVYPPIDGTDGWVAKLNSSGLRQWYTFLGSVDFDSILNIAVDEYSHVYVAGRSLASWGNPVNAYTGGSDVFVAKLNSSGERLWHTFMGSAGNDHGHGIAVDTNGNIYVSGTSEAPWGAPINPWVSVVPGGPEGFAAKLDANGVRQWHTFLGSEGVGMGWGLALDGNRNIYVGGIPNFVKLGSDGVLRWRISTEGGGSGEGNCIAVDTSGNVYLGGGSGFHWGEPVNPFMGRWDAWVAKFVGTADHNYAVAAVAHTPGVGTSLWRSKLGVLNRSGKRADVTLSYVRGGSTTTTTERIAHGVLKTWDDAAVNLFGIQGNSSGSVFVDSTQPLVVTSRTYDEGVDGTFGSFLPGVTVDEDLGYGEVGVLSQLCGNDDFRTNVGLVNLVSAVCWVRVQVYAADGTEMGSPDTVPLNAYGFKQINDVFRSTGSGSLDNAYVIVEVTDPGCRVWGYGAVIDGVAAHPGTDDATTIPLAIVRQ